MRSGPPARAGIRPSSFDVQLPNESLQLSSSVRQHTRCLIRHALTLVWVSLAAGCLNKEVPEAADTSVLAHADAGRAAAATALAVSVEPPSPEVLRILRPMVEDRIRARADVSDSAGWVRESPFTKAYLASLDTIMTRRDPLGDEAVVAARRIYFGEHAAHTLDCEIMDRGPRMLPLVRRFGPQLATTWFPELPADLALDTSFTADLIVALDAGDTCGW